MYGLAGPCLAIDTACSSSLVATSAAHNSLMLGQTASALAGGVNLLLSANTHAMYSVAGLAQSLVSNLHFARLPRWNTLPFLQSSCTFRPDAQGLDFSQVSYIFCSCNLEEFT